MKIAIVGPIESAMTADSVGGTETWTYHFAEELVRRGHEVTLFGAEGTKFSGKFVEICSHSDIVDPKIGSLNRLRFATFSVQEMIELVKRLDDFDLVHVSYYSFHYFLPFSSMINKPIVETIHGSPLTREDMEILFKKYEKPYFVFPTKSSADRWPKPKRGQIIYHGIKTEQFPFNENKREDFFFWMSRIVEQKGVDDAIKFAQKTGSRLIIAGPKNEEAYFDKTVKPHLSDKIQYVGELGFAEKIKYYERAKAFLMPIKWDEPFGLVMVEAMACGTPVIAYSRGSVPEIVDSQTGFACPPDDFESFAKAGQVIQEMSEEDYQKMSKACRKKVEDQFTFKRMVDEYEAIFDRARLEP